MLRCAQHTCFTSVFTPFNSGFCVGNHAKTPRIRDGLNSNLLHLPYFRLITLLPAVQQDLRDDKKHHAPAQQDIPKNLHDHCTHTFPPFRVSRRSNRFFRQSLCGHRISSSTLITLIPGQEFQDMNVRGSVISTDGDTLLPHCPPYGCFRMLHTSATQPPHRKTRFRVLLSHHARRPDT